MFDLEKLFWYTVSAAILAVFTSILLELIDVTTIVYPPAGYERTLALMMLDRFMYTNYRLVQIYRDKILNSGKLVTDYDIFKELLYIDFYYPLRLNSTYEIPSPPYYIRAFLYPDHPSNFEIKSNDGSQKITTFFAPVFVMSSHYAENYIYSFTYEPLICFPNDICLYRINSISSPTGEVGVFDSSILFYSKKEIAQMLSGDEKNIYVIFPIWTLGVNKDQNLELVYLGFEAYIEGPKVYYVPNLNYGGP